MHLKKTIAAILIFTLSWAIATDAVAARKNSYKSLQNSKYAAFVVDSDTGKILHQEKANQKRYPASLTKMMTLYLMFESMKKSKIRMSTRMRVSAKAASQPQTNISLKAGSTIRVRDAIPALIIRSANDVAVVVAEHLAGSEAKFAKIMTARARQLGMTKTTFKNPHGLPNSKQITTAKDMTILSIALKKHYPQYAHFFTKSSFTYNGKKYKTHNKLVQEYKGANGLKTGYINASGFNVATSVKRREGNVIGVVMGGKTSSSRNAQMRKLLDEAYVKMALLKKNRITSYANAHIYPVSKGYRSEGGYARYSSARVSGDISTAAKTYVPPKIVATARTTEFTPTPREKPRSIARN